MIDPLLFLPPLVSLLATLLFLPSWIKRAKSAGLAGKDVHKLSSQPVAEAGGVTVVAGFVIGVLIYVALKTFHFSSEEHVVEIFALISTVLLISLVGLVDGILGWKKGLGKRVRIMLVFFASIPLMVINAGHTTVSLGFNVVELGLFYTLFLIPLGIVGASTTFNFMEGYNGLAARQGILILSALALAIYLTGNSWLALILSCMVASLVAFLFFNRYPAKVFPGDVLTYALGGLIAIAAILGNIEQFAAFLFIPYVIEVVLKVRGRLQKESFAKVLPDGSLDLRYPKVYGLEHLAIMLIKKVKKKAYEEEVVAFINVVQLLFILIAFIIFKGV